MAVLNYTTQIEVSKTIGEVQRMLAEHGANRIGIEYADKQPSAISFEITTETGTGVFTLPVNVAAMNKLLVQQARAGKLKSVSRAVAESREHAARVAWRVIKDWLEAQLALIETRMVTFDQVMLPFMRLGELTVYEEFLSQRALTSGTDVR